MPRTQTVIFSIILTLASFGLAHANQIYAQATEAGTAAKLYSPSITPIQDIRVLQLEEFLASYDSPLTADAEHFVHEADRNNLDWKLVASIAGLESSFGKHIPSNSYNGWGWGIPTGAQRGIEFQSWRHAITTISEGLKNNYINKGAVSLEQIGYIYAASPTWAQRVRFFMDKIEKTNPHTPRNLEVTL